MPRLLCRTEGISAGATAGGFDVQACEAAERECNASGEYEIDDELMCNFEEVEDCDVTVGEFADCYEQAATLSKRFLADLTCAAVASGNVGDESDYQLSASCEQLLDGCGGSSSTTSDSDTDTDGGETGTAGETGAEPPE